MNSTTATVRIFYSEIAVGRSGSPRQDSCRKISMCPRHCRGEETVTTALSSNCVQNGHTQTELAEWYDVRRTFGDERSIAGSSGSPVSSRSSRPVPIVTELGETESLQNKRRKGSKERSTNHPRKLASTRRRSSSSISTRRTTSNTRSRAVGGRSRKRDCALKKPRRTTADGQESFCENLEKAAGNGRHTSLYRSTQEIRAIRAVCRGISPRHAAVCRSIWPP